jgi:hypothetical protein
MTTTYYIVDAWKPVFVRAKTILVTSPIHRIWYEINKDKCTYRFMPIWSEEEILKCRAELYRDLSEALVKKLYRQWGSIPRDVLGKAAREKKNKIVSKLIWMQ